jgi:hypothetical protein
MTIATQMNGLTGSIHQRGTQPQPLLFLSQMFPRCIDASGRSDTLHPSAPLCNFVVCQRSNRNLIMKFLFATSAKEIARQRDEAKSMADPRTTSSPPGEAGSRFPTPHAVVITTVPTVKAAILPKLGKDGERRALRRSVAKKPYTYRRVGIAANAYPLFPGAIGHDKPKLLLPHIFDGVIAVYLLVQPAMLLQAIIVKAQQNWNGTTTRRRICTVRRRGTQKTFEVFQSHARVRPEGLLHGEIRSDRRFAANESPTLCRATTAVSSAAEI